MTQLITIDRATLEQLVAALNEVDQHIDLKRYDTAPNEVLFDVVMEALKALHAALANAEPKKVEKVKKREPTIDLGKYAGTYGGYIKKEQS